MYCIRVALQVFALREKVRLDSINVDLRRHQREGGHLKGNSDCCIHDASWIQNIYIYLPDPLKKGYCLVEETGTYFCLYSEL